MTIIEKMYAGEKLSEDELSYLTDEYNNDIKSGNYEIITEIEGDHSRWHQYMETIIKVGEDYWCIPWMSGLTEYQESEFMYQPYRVKRKERIVTEVYYVEV